MLDSFPLLYLSILTTILGVLAFFVIREVLRNRQQEKTLRQLRGKLSKNKGTPEEYFQLGSVYLNKRLYQQAAIQFAKAQDQAEEPLPVVSNALGYTYFSQGQYDVAIRNYKEAVKAAPDYVVAWNNLGHAYEKKNLVAPALEAYEEALKLEPKNGVAKRRADSLRKRLSTSQESKTS